MTLNDHLANVLSSILNYEKLGKKRLENIPLSKLLMSVLSVMKKHGYIGDLKEKEVGNKKFLLVNLIGKINKCGVIKPRHSVKVKNFEKFEQRYLPARDVGILILSTPHGIMAHQESKEKITGGKLLAYCY